MIDQPPTDQPQSGQPQLEEFIDPVDGTRWKIDVGFTDSNWTCIWGNGCEGILDRPAADLNQGCCSEGAHLLGEDEAMMIEALGLTLDPAHFQNHAEATANGVLREAPTNANGGKATRVVNDACIFHNEPDFAGGAGCALHIAAVQDGEAPMDWKPTICWQVPIRVDDNADGSKTLRRWNRADWGTDGTDLAWCCTEANNQPAAAGPTAYVGSEPVAESLHAELTGILGPEIAVELRRHARQTD